MGVSVKTVRKYARKFRILMAESNIEKILNASYYEIDIIKKNEGTVGKAADKQHVLSDHKTQPIKDYLENHVIINHDPAFKWLNATTGNYEFAIKFIDRRVQKKNLPLYLARQE